MRRRHGSFALLRELAPVVGCLALPGAALAATLEVPAGYATITAALAAAAPGDDVVVAPGTYSATSNGETFPLQLDTDGVQLLAGEPGVVLDAEGVASVVRIDVATDARLSGFTITGGIATRGGGVFVLAGSPEVDHNLITGNGAVFRGAGLFAYTSATPWVHHNVVWENFDSDTTDLVDPHGIVFQDEAAGTVEHNLVGRTDGNGLLTAANARPVVRHNIFLENGQPDPLRGRGICWLADTPAIITHNLFHANTVAAVLWTAGGGNFSGIGANGVDPLDDVYGNLDGDPLLADPEGGDFHLTPGSPAIDAGDPTLPLDPDGTVADLGPFALDQTALGAPTTDAAPAWRAYPNPFRSGVTLVRGPGGSASRVDILDVRGRRVRTIRSNGRDIGVSWDGRDASGHPAAAGVYYARVTDAAARVIDTVPLVRLP